MKREGILLAIAGMILAAACIVGVKMSSHPLVPIREGADCQSLTIWAWDNTFNVKAAHIAADYYKRNNPDAQIEVVSKERIEIVKLLEAGLSSKVYDDLPDIVLIEDYQAQAFLARYENEFKDLSEEVAYEEFMDYKVEISSYSGKRYGIPFDSGTAVLFYRLDYLEQAGYSEETMQELTWDEFIEIAQAVKQKTGKYMLTVQPNDLGLIRIMLQSAGAWYVKEDGVTVHIEENQALQEAVSIYKQLLEQDLVLSISGWNDYAKAFQENSVAAVASGCWVASTIKEQETQAGKWRVAEIPRMDKKQASVNASSIGGSSWYVLNHKPNADMAVAFMKQTIAGNKEYLNELVSSVNLVSTMKSAKQFPNNQKADEFFGDRNIRKFFYQTMENIPVVNYGMFTYEIENILEDMIQSVLEGENTDFLFHNAQIKAQAIVGK